MAKLAPGAKYATPEEVQAPGPKPPKLDGAPMFLFTHHRLAWEVRQGAVVPRLARQNLVGGVNLIRRVNGKWDLSQFRAWATERGRQIIPWNVDAPEFDSYMQRVGPGMYLDRFTTAYSGSSHVTFDEPAYVKWQKSLVSRGIIQKPQIDALEMLQKQLERAIDGAGMMAASLPEAYRGSRDDVLTRLKSDLEAVKKEIGKLQKTARPARAKSHTPEVIE